MQWVIILMLGALTSSVFYQDYKTRSVIWILFPCILFMGIWYTLYYTDSLKLLFVNTGINIGFIILQFCFLKLLFGFKKIVNKKIGSGDIFFVVCCCTFFSPANFLLFYVLSLLFSLCVHFSLGLLTKNYLAQTVPLAGLQCVFLFLFISTSILSDNNMANDEWLTSVLIYG